MRNSMLIFSCPHFGALRAGMVDFYQIILDRFLQLGKGRSWLGVHLETVFQVVADKESFKDGLVHELFGGVIGIEVSFSAISVVTNSLAIFCYSVLSRSKGSRYCSEIQAVFVVCSRAWLFDPYCRPALSYKEQQSVA